MTSFRIPFGVKMVQGFACTHCGGRNQLYRSVASAARHLDQCIRNPATRSCATCRHDYAGDHDASCTAGVRPDSVQIVRRCQEWEPKA